MIVIIDWLIVLIGATGISFIISGTIGNIIVDNKYKDIIKEANRDLVVGIILSLVSFIYIYIRT